MRKYLIIVPVYNEELNIINVNKELQNLSTSINYIFINDGSKDNTEKILIENKIPHISLIHNLGIGGAVQTGYKYAYENNYDYAIQFDGDGQHDIKYIKDILTPLENMQADLVVGSRFIKKNLGKFKSTKMRQFGISIISFFIKLFTGEKIYDTTSGFRACNKSIIKFFSNSYPLEYPEPVSTFELLKNGYKIKEVPVKMNERKGGQSSIHTWKSVYYMINVIFSIIICSIRRYK